MKYLSSSLSALLLFSSAAFAGIIVDFQDASNAVGSTGATFVLEDPGNNGGGFDTTSATFSDAFGAGLDLDVTLTRLSARNNFTAALTGGSFAGDQILGDGLSNRNGGENVDLSLTLGAGTYDFTSWQHSGALGSTFDELADISVSTDGGSSFTLVADDLGTTTGTSPSVVSTLTTQFTADGTNDVVIRYNVTDAFTINGFDISAVVPEPATFAMIAGGAALGLVMLRRRSRN